MFGATVAIYMVAYYIKKKIFFYEARLSSLLFR